MYFFQTIRKIILNHSMVQGKRR